MAKRSFISTDSPRRPDRWREGKHLPHWEARYIPHSISFRLHDAIPNHVIEKWKKELVTEEQEEQQKMLYKRIERYMDQGYGACWLDDQRVARCVNESLLHFDGDRYELHAWVVMPNHVHVLVSVVGDRELGDIVHSWKSYTAQQANDLLDRSGSFWMKDYHDRYIRNGEHFWNVVQYIEHNPVSAGLCDQPEEWRWGSAYHKSEGYF